MRVSHAAPTGPLQQAFAKRCEGSPPWFGVHYARGGAAGEHQPVERLVRLAPKRVAFDADSSLAKVGATLLNVAGSREDVHDNWPETPPSPLKRTDLERGRPSLAENWPHVALNPENSNLIQERCIDKRKDAAPARTPPTFPTYTDLFVYLLPAPASNTHIPELRGASAKPGGDFDQLELVFTSWSCLTNVGVALTKVGVPSANLAIFI